MCAKHKQSKKVKNAGINKKEFKKKLKPIDYFVKNRSRKLLMYELKEKKNIVFKEDLNKSLSYIDKAKNNLYWLEKESLLKDSKTYIEKNYVEKAEDVIAEMKMTDKYTAYDLEDLKKNKVDFKYSKVMLLTREHYNYKNMKYEGEKHTYYIVSMPLKKKDRANRRGQRKKAQAQQQQAVHVGGKQPSAMQYGGKSLLGRKSRSLKSLKKPAPAQKTTTTNVSTIENETSSSEDSASESESDEDGMKELSQQQSSAVVVQPQQQQQQVQQQSSTVQPQQQQQAQVVIATPTTQSQQQVVVVDKVVSK